MRSRGFSFVELVLVTCIMSTLLAIATLIFSDYLDRYHSESQTRRIYASLLKARADAVYRRRGTRVKLYTRTFEVYSSACDNCDEAVPVQREDLMYPVTCNAAGNGRDGYILEFDSRGVANRDCSICVGERGKAGGVDSIIMSPTRVSIGKRDASDDCKADNITVR